MNPRTVLVAEDEPLLAQLVCDYLGMAGLPVLVAGDGAAALELFHARRDDIGLALVDLTMPGMDGWELVRRLRAESTTLPIVVTSGHGAVASELAGQDVAQFLSKPYRPSEVLRVVRALMR